MFFAFNTLEHTLTVWQVTVDLDVLVRDDLLTFLKKDSIARGATILCKNNDMYSRSSTLAK